MKGKLKILKDIERSNFIKAHHHEVHGEINLNKSPTREILLRLGRGSSKRNVLNRFMFCSWLAWDRRKGPELVMQYPRDVAAFYSGLLFKMVTQRQAKSNSLCLRDITNIVILVFIVFRKNGNAINVRIARVACSICIHNNFGIRYLITLSN